MAYATKEKKADYDKRRWANIRQQRGRNSLIPGNLPIGTAKDLKIVGPKEGLKIAVVPDVQAMPGVPLDHLAWYGKYIAAKRPDVIVCIGDFGDFPSLSHFERGTLAFEGRRYMKDLAAFYQAMELFLTPIRKANGYNPRMEFTLGNHEDHVSRTVREDPKLEGLMSLADLQLEQYGWNVHPFLQPIAIGGVAFCHYFPSGQMGRPIGTARAILTKLHMSAVAGHQQGWDIAYSRRADGAHMGAIIAGSFYQHSYEYLSPFTNAHWRGAYFLHEVRDGRFDEMKLSIDYLKRRFK